MSETEKNRKNGLIPEISSFISHHSSLQFKQRFTLIELLVNIACYVRNATGKMMNDERGVMNFGVGFRQLEYSAVHRAA